MTEDRPSQVSAAVSLMWGIWAAGLLYVLVINSNYIKSSGLPAIAIVIALGALNVLLIYNVARGRNWARVTYLILFIMDLPAIPKIVLPMFSRSVVFGMLNLGAHVVRLVVICLLFTKPSSNWFRRTA